MMSESLMKIDSCFLEEVVIEDRALKLRGSGVAGMPRQFRVLAFGWCRDIE